MAYDKIVDSSVLDGNLTSIANAIREKAELTENFAFPQGFIEAISGIESGGGNVIMGTITPNETSSSIIINLAEYGYIQESGEWPRARFLLECNLSYDDVTHTKTRVLSVLQFNPVEKNNNETNNFLSVTVYENSGSSSPTSKLNTVAKMWYQDYDGINGSLVYRAIGGNIFGETTEFYIAPTSSTYGPIAGRTYIWGVIL